jgi:hypothetical protein
MSFQKLLGLLQPCVFNTKAVIKEPFDELGSGLGFTYLHHHWCTNKNKINTTTKIKTIHFLGWIDFITTPRHRTSCFIVSLI